MGRPKKNTGTPEARQRIIDSFWDLLQDYRLRDITVGMIAREADCNRGTFYYHFNDMDDLVYSAIEEELRGDEQLSMDIFNMITGAGDDAIEKLLGGTRIQRLSLAIRQGGTETVENVVKAVLIDMWRTVLCPDGGDLTEQTRLIIEYTSSGILGVASYCTKLHEQGGETEVDLSILKRMASYTLSLVAEAQDIPEDEILMRLKILNQFSRIQNR